MSLLEADIRFMNMIDSEFIRSYCLDKFKDNYRLSSNDTELVIPSLFVARDPKRHMSINLETGLWRCFKTGESGNFVKLYSQTENIPYKQAYEKFLFESFINPLPEKKEVPQDPRLMDSMEYFVPIKNSRKAITYLEDRFGSYILEYVIKYDFLYAIDGFYKDRIIIPYRKESGEIFYFQARALSGQEPKYLNCRNYRSSEILYPFNYNSFSPLYITEGVFDCLTLKGRGLHATTTLSCQVSDAQMAQLKLYQGPLVVAYDNDEAGKKGTRNFLRLALKHKMSNLFFTEIPYRDCKDWNECIAYTDLIDDMKMTPLTTLNLAVSEL